ncbi:hypothetical protein ACFL4V_00465 [Candidatus Latescibacterota bacterium]
MCTRFVNLPVIFIVFVFLAFVLCSCANRTYVQKTLVAGLITALIPGFILTELLSRLVVLEQE